MTECACGSIPALHGYWDKTMLPGQIAARVWNPRRFLPYAFFKSDFALAALDAAPQKRVRVA